MYFPLSGVVSGDVRFDKAQIWFGDKHGQYIPECFSMVVSAEEGEYGFMDRLRFTSFGSGGWSAGNMVGDVVLNVEYGKTIAFKEDVYEKNEVYTKAEVDSQISSKADKTVYREVPDPQLSDTWYEDNDHTTMRLSSYDPPTWTSIKSGQTFTLTFQNGTWTFSSNGAATYNISGDVDDLVVRYPVSWGYLTITRNYGTKIVPSNVVYADDVYTKAEVDAIIQKLKDDNNLV